MSITDDIVGGIYEQTDYQPGVPLAQVEEESKANAVIAASYPIMQDVAQWFDEQIAACDSISNLELGGKTSLESQVHAYQLLKQILEDKRASFGTIGGKA